MSNLPTVGVRAITLHCKTCFIMHVARHAATPHATPHNDTFCLPPSTCTGKKYERYRTILSESDESDSTGMRPAAAARPPSHRTPQTATVTPRTSRREIAPVSADGETNEQRDVDRAGERAAAARRGRGLRPRRALRRAPRVRCKRCARASGWGGRECGRVRGRGSVRAATATTPAASTAGAGTRARFEPPRT